MKKIIFFLLIPIASFSQKDSMQGGVIPTWYSTSVTAIDYITTENKEAQISKIEKEPITIFESGGSYLCETTIVWVDGEIAHFGIRIIETCDEYRQFRKNYPYYFIDNRIAAKFKRCSK